MVGTCFAHAGLCNLLPIGGSLTIVDVHGWCVSTVSLWVFWCVSNVEGNLQMHTHIPPPPTHTHICVQLYFIGQVLFLYCSSILGRNNSQIDCWTFEGYCNGFRRPMFSLYLTLCSVHMCPRTYRQHTHTHTNIHTHTKHIDRYLLPQQQLLEMPWPTPGCLELGSAWAKTCSGSLLWSAHGHSWSCSHTSLWTGRRNDEYNEVAPNHLNYQLYQSTV